MKTRRNARGGFTLLEVAISLFLIVMIWISAVASMRSGLRSMSGTELVATATTAVRELREFTYPLSIDDIDALGGTSMAPTLSDGSPMSGSGDLVMLLQVQAVDDFDPTLTVDPASSRTRIVTVQCMSRDRMVLEAQWLAAEH